MSLESLFFLVAYEKQNFAQHIIQNIVTLSVICGNLNVLRKLHLGC